MSWICRIWKETSLDGWTSEIERFKTEKEALEFGRTFIKEINPDELSREYDTWEEAPEAFFPNPTCREDLEARGFAVSKHGPYVLAIGYFYTKYCAALYEYLSEDKSKEGVLGIYADRFRPFTDWAEIRLWTKEKTGI